MPLTIDTLPVRLSTLIGREGELGDIRRSLDGCRLLTLTGPGGDRRRDLREHGRAVPGRRLLGGTRAGR